MSRRQARTVAVETLYAADVRSEPVALVFEARLEEDPTVPGYTDTLLRGVDARRDEIDAILARTATHWPLDRMSVVDRNVLRVGVFELLEGSTPAPVVLDEAVELAKRFSGEQAGRFVNGVLGAVLRELAETRG